jgi:hypothetical protein
MMVAALVFTTWNFNKIPKMYFLIAGYTTMPKKKKKTGY